MPSQGLGPRRSVLPLLISFLFSHIVLAERPLPLALPSPSSPFPRSFLFPSSFSFLPLSSPAPPPSFHPFPSLLLSVSLFISTLAAYLAPWESARAIRAAREEVLIPVSCAALLLSLSLSLSLESSRSTRTPARVLRVHLLIPPTSRPARSMSRESHSRTLRAREIIERRSCYHHHRPSDSPIARNE